MKKKKPGCLIALLVVVAIIVVLFVWVKISDTMRENRAEQQEYEALHQDLNWPSVGLATMLPAPPSMTGRLHMDNADLFNVDVSEVSSEQFREYVEACRENGFTVDYSQSNDYYTAKNEEGYDLYLRISDENVMTVRLSAPQPDETENNAVESDETETDAVIVAPPKTSAETQAAPETEQHSDNGQIRSEVRNAIDSYEQIMNEYCDFMETYNSSDDPMSMLEDYAQYMADYTQAMNDFAAIEDMDLNDAELAYYNEVNLRVNQRLLSVAS